MPLAPHRHRHLGTRGGTVTRALLITVGITLTLFGLVFLAATLALLFEGDRDALYLFPFVLASCVGGVFITASQARDAKEGQPSSGGVGLAPVASAPTTPPPGTAAPAPSPSQRDEATSPTPSVATTAGADSSASVAQLVVRSSDLFATLRDLVGHEGAAGSDKRHLVTMLEAAGVMAWPDAPACEGGQLFRTDHFWIRLNPDELSERHYDTLLMTEAALSVNQDLPEVRAQDRASEPALQAVLGLMRGMCDQDIPHSDITDEGLRACYGDTAAGARSGEWLVRSRICHAAECARTPFRVVFDLRCNVADGLVVIDLEIPRPRCMAIFVRDAESQANLARAYALRLSTLLARQSFATSGRVRRVVVNGHEHGSDRAVLSIDFSGPVLDALLEAARGPQVESVFPSDPAIRAWVEPIEPFVPLDSPLAFPAHARTFPELDTRPASEALARACRVARVCDLGINESAFRIAAWTSVSQELGDTTEQAVSALVALRDKAQDITVAEACARTMRALVDGDIDLDDLGRVASLFVEGSALDKAVSRAIELLDDSQGPPDPEAALKLLEEALAPIDDMGAYLDDETTVYRYFGSVAERVRHNLSVDEGGRTIALVPDSYFNAHSNASIALGMLGRNEEALAHADVCLRLAPTSTYAAMRKVRVLEAQSRIFKAADLIIEALYHANTPRDASICHYRLAYMQWKLGRESLAAACYQRSLSWDTEMSAQAREELDDLLQSSPVLTRPTKEQADALLIQEGIPLGCTEEDGSQLLAAAVACMDQGVLMSARPLMASIFGMTRDDVMMGVYRSLSVSV